MKKKVLTSLELFAVVEELSTIKGALVDKIYQLSSKELLIYLFKTGAGKQALKVDSGHGIFLTNYQLKKPPYPSSFCMFLRKHLNRAQIVSVKQKDLERIVEIHLNSKAGELILILELFSKGNFILTDSNYKIINVANVQKWKARTVKKGEIYQYPPLNSIDLVNLTYNSFANLFESDKEVVKFLAVDLGIGGIYSEEICELAGINKDTPVNKIDSKLAKKLFNSLKEIVARFDSRNYSPGIIKEDSQIIDAVPFKIKKYPNYERTVSWNQALDTYFTNITTSNILEKKEDEYLKKYNKLRTVLDKQQTSLDEYKQKSEKYNQIAEELYKKYDVIYGIITKIKQAKEAGYSLEQLKEAVEKEKEEEIYEANLIKELNHDSIILNLEEEIEFKFDKSIEKTAEFFYEKSKDYKSKIPGAERIVQETLAKMKKLEDKKSELKYETEDDLPTIKEKTKEKWFEKFHWFYTSNGKLAIGGRDATQNDILLKKYIEPRDFIFHTEMAGSPFFVLKDGADSEEKEVKEVAIATVSYSRAWREGLSATDAYYVRPEQVSKTAPSGEYVGKGAWMIRGKKHIFKDVKLEIAIGVTDDNEVIGGPVIPIAKKCNKYMIINPGWNKKSDTAKKFMDKLNVNKKELDKIIRFLPAGDSTITSFFP